MPHLMNCPHSDDSWCLECVGKLHREKEYVEAARELEFVSFRVARAERDSARARVVQLEAELRGMAEVSVAATEALGFRLKALEQCANTLLILDQVSDGETRMQLLAGATAYAKTAMEPNAAPSTLGDDEGSAHFADNERDGLCVKCGGDYGAHFAPDGGGCAGFTQSRVAPIRQSAGELDTAALRAVDALVRRSPADPNFLAGAHLIAADFQRSLAGKQISAEDVGAIAINMQLLAEKVARLYASSAPEARAEVPSTTEGDVDHSAGQGDSKSNSETSAAFSVRAVKDHP